MDKIQGKTSSVNMDKVTPIESPKKYDKPTEDTKLQASIAEGVQTSPSIEMPDIKTDTAKMESAMKERQAELKAKTEEEQEAKHRKAEKMWSAIGDGISAIANMATVGAGADSMYNPADSLHSKVKSKWDEVKANKAAIAAANRKAQMDLLLKDLELGAKAKEAEANRNFNIWKVGTEEEGKNQRAKEEQEFKASEYQKNRDNDKEVAKIRGKYSRSSGGSSSTGKYFFNGVAYKSASERNQAILNAAKKFKDFNIYDDDDNLRDWDVMAVELEELIKNDNQIDLSGL
jgi:hypothetical protein